VAIGVVAAGLGLWFAKRQAEAPARQVAPPRIGLPDTPDYHALLVSSSDARRIVLGTHAGLYESSDGGRSWRKGPLAGNDAMNLVRTRSGLLWAAGHNVLYSSADNGNTWKEVRPKGLPGLDLHGFAADPRDGRTLYAAVAQEGLYRSSDGGNTFELVTDEVGGNVFGLAVTRTGRILAADPKRGVRASDDGGRTWKHVLPVSMVGVAVNRSQQGKVLATGDGVYLSSDAGLTWRKVLSPPGGAGPVAWARSDPGVAYIVGFDVRLYRTADGGESWRPVG
jgi:photosystem II stability/assembly factor-like uncharacterized protein